MHAILGIDAAWTASAASGIALIVGNVGGWRCLRAAPSRRAFVAGGGEAAVELASSAKHDDVSLVDVIEVAKRLAGVDALSVVAVDMPLARGAIVARRAADTAVSRAYGARKCAVHSPTPARPGVLACRMRDEAGACGFPLITEGGGETPALIEVYPHVTVLDLVGAEERVKYKVARARKYWPEWTRAQRVAGLVASWRSITDALTVRLGALPIVAPETVGDATRVLKAYEDMLDGIVCAWTGALYLERRASAMGDGNAAIWVPRVGS